MTRNFKNIKTFKDACDVLNYDYTAVNNTIRNIAVFSRASAAAFKLNIVRKALNLGHELPFINYSKDSVIYYPDNPFINKDSSYYNIDKIETIGKFKYKGEEYCVLNRDVYNGNFGLSNFSLINGIGYADANFGLLGCASKEIAIHLSLIHI